MWDDTLPGLDVRLWTTRPGFQMTLYQAWMSYATTRPTSHVFLLMTLVVYLATCVWFSFTLFVLTVVYIVHLFPPLDMKLASVYMSAVTSIIQITIPFSLSIMHKYNSKIQYLMITHFVFEGVSCFNSVRFTIALSPCESSQYLKPFYYNHTNLSCAAFYQA